MAHKLLVVALLLAALSAGRVVRCARILGVFPITSISHQMVYRALMTELARRGHQLVVITPNPVNDTSIANYTEIDVSFMYDMFRSTFNFAVLRGTYASWFDETKLHVGYGELWSEQLLGDDAVRKLISPDNKDEHFDLVFLEWLTMTPICGFAHRFSAPMIGIISFPPFSFNHDSVGNPTNPAYIPEAFMPYTDRMTFFERLDTLVNSLRIRNFFYNTVMPRLQTIANRHFGPSMPSLMEMHYNVSMLFVNFEPSFHPPRPEVPAIVHVSGLHLKPPKPLPQELQQFLDSAPRGAVYFSLGSNVRSDKLDAAKRQMFVDAFAQLDGYHVLWKWESDNLPGQPANVMIRKWMPQQDILRHPKTKAFILQGGLQSTEEAIHYGVPVIGIPFMADQDYNTKRIVEKGIGLKLEFTEISKETILKALRTVLQDKSFQDNVQRLSAIMRDQQMSSMERAVWWTEYVLRHKGAAHLRTAAVDMPWYQYLLLDVLAFLLVIILLVILLIWKTVKFLYCKLTALRSSKPKKS